MLRKLDQRSLVPARGNAREGRSPNRDELFAVAQNSRNHFIRNKGAIFLVAKGKKKVNTRALADGSEHVLMIQLNFIA